MSFRYALTGVLLAMVVTAGVVVVAGSSALASHIDFDQLRAEREAAREARRAEREAEREARRNEDSQENQEEPACSCTTRLGFARPDLQFLGGTLSLIPRVDVSITSRGELSDPSWEAVLTYDGSADFSSEDISAPGPVAFSGAQTVASGSCGDRYSFSGYQLPAVPFSGLVRSLLGLDQELDGVVRLHAQIDGCGFDEEHRQFGFTMEQFGNLSIGSWRLYRP